MAAGEPQGPTDRSGGLHTWLLPLQGDASEGNFTGVDTGQKLDNGFTCFILQFILFRFELFFMYR